jgi:hypothetical protein
MLWMNQGQFRFLRAACFGLVNLKGAVGLILAKTGYEDFYTTRFVFSACYTTTEFHSF